MSNPDFIELSARCEALARVVLHLAANLEERGLMDGHDFQEGLLASRPSGTPALDRTGALMGELASSMSAARAGRRTQEMWSRNRSDRREDA